MTKGKFTKRLLHTIVATMYTVPYSAAHAGEHRPEGETASRAEQLQQAVRQEVVQLVREEGSPGAYKFNIAGQPGVHFKIYYSPTGDEGSYRPLPGGAGAVMENGFLTLTLELKDLAEEVLYLQVFTSDTADFSGEVRTGASRMAVPLAAKGEAELELRGDDQPLRVGTLGIRGRLPEEGPFQKPVIPR